MAENTWQIAPATNSVTFYAGGEMLYELNPNMGLRAALEYSYISGDVSVTALLIESQSRRKQIYHRLQLPVMFIVKSDDSFWFSLGPTFFVTLADNNALEDAIESLTQFNVPLDAKVPVGVAMRLLTNIRLSKNLYLEVKFDYDIGRHFNYDQTNQQYDVKMAMQGITSGINYIF